MISRLVNLVLFKLMNFSCHVHHTATVTRKAKVGLKCKFAKNSGLSSTVFIGDNVSVGEGVKLRNITIGSNTMIESGVRIVGPKKGRIVVGRDCYIGVNNVFDTSNNISIGNFVHIAGPSTALWCHTSVDMCLKSIPLNDKKKDQYRPTKEIVIEDNVYIGCNCTIYPGVKISKFSVVSPNSAVVKNVGSGVLAGGVPAKTIKRIS